MTNPPAAQSYDRRTIVLHWLTVLLVAGQWLGAHAIDWFPKGPLRVDARSMHIVFGVLLGAVIAARLVWRWSAGRKLPPADQGLLRVASSGVHALLYGLLILTVCLGLANAWAGGDSLFNVFSLPKLVVSKDVRGQIGDMHGLCANAILVLATLHAAAALWHQYIRRDGVLARMVPVLARPGAKERV